MPLTRKPAKPIAIRAREPAEIFATLRDPDADLRWSAARDAAGATGGGAALAAALPGETDPRVREAMFTGLAQIGSPQAVDAVIALLRSDDANLRGGALEALRLMAPRTADLLPRLLTDADGDIRILSCELARALESAEASRLMCRVLDDDTQSNVCAAAVEVLAEVGGPEALPSLQRGAARFSGTPFLAFAIQVVIDRIGAGSSTTRG